MLNSLKSKKIGYILMTLNFCSIFLYPPKHVLAFMLFGLMGAVLIQMIFFPNENKNGPCSGIL